MKSQPSLRRAALLLLAGGVVLLGLPGPAAAQLDNTVWPMFHHDLRHTGQSPLLGPMFGPSGPVLGTDVTYWQGFDKYKTSPSIGGDGTIYIGLAFNLCAIKPDMTRKTSFGTNGCVKLDADVSASSPAIRADG